MARLFLLVVVVWVSGCSQVRVFPREVNLFGEGSEYHLTQVLEMLEEHPAKNAALSLVLWPKNMGFIDHPMQQSWVTGFSQSDGSCEQAIYSSLERCRANAEQRTDNPLREQPFLGCFVFAIKCPAIDEEMGLRMSILDGLSQHNAAEKTTD